MSSRIEDYALIGDLETAALVAKDGSIDWLCWPRFDSAACFAAMLGSPENGRWQLCPAGPIRSTRRHYRDDTLILETEVETSDGAVTIIDFMPPREEHSDLVRLVRGRRGQVPMKMELSLRFAYGKYVPWVTQPHRGLLRAVAGPQMAVLRTEAPLQGEDLKTFSEFTVRAGETVPFVLTYQESHLGTPRALDPGLALRQTETFWRQWIRQCCYRGSGRAAVRRSLITLKALTYWPTGGILAAPTASLPEKLGGTRNWDYRFCWLRDASYTLLALIRAGYHSEAGEWLAWLLRAVAGSPDQVQIMYGVGGERELYEREVKWLDGYDHSRPVRVGNAASEQLQLDIYGEVMSAMHYAHHAGHQETKAERGLQVALLKHLEKVWRKPDNGIWEMRGPRRHFTHSKVMAWLAFDRAIKSAEQFGLRGPVDRWRAVREEIHQDVCRNGYDAKLGSFVQFYGSKHVDASLLQIAKVGFLPATDPRVKGTVRAIERELAHDGFVLRYKTDQAQDGLPAGEGTFLICSFWLADNYVLMGQRAKASRLFKKLVELCNDVGLLAEEYDPKDKRMLGNFPQAYSHIALAHTAFELAGLPEYPKLKPPRRPAP
ncbi:MAG TPA: glycoside hydrolase family 15 protein [Candidatus Cybelea sp.]|nr:glycoside hydrolase family 15 protein [Candidatus Cybelea sp.]